MTNHIYFLDYFTNHIFDMCIWAGLEIATNTVANATNISSLATKTSGLVAKMATRFSVLMMNNGHFLKHFVLLKHKMGIPFLKKKKNIQNTKRSHASIHPLLYCERFSKNFQMACHASNRPIRPSNPLSTSCMPTDYVSRITWLSAMLIPSRILRIN